MRQVAIVGVAVFAVGAAVLVPMPAQSSTPMTPPPVPSFAGDFIIPPEGTPRTKLPRFIHSHGSTTYRQGLYDVHILVAASDDGPAPWDETAARRHIEEMDAWSLAQTAGNYRFRLGSFQTLPAYPGSLCGVDAALRHAEPELAALTVSPGATDALPVIVAPLRGDCGAAGQALLGSPGAWVGSSRAVPGYDLVTLIHEIFHNLGLEHAGAVEPGAQLAQPWPNGVMPPISEYGDASDVMGSPQWICTVGPCKPIASGLSAHHRNVLGTVPTDEIAYVPMATGEQTTTLDIVSVTGAAPGTRVAYLPWLNRSKFSIEYRPATGSDSRLDGPYGPGSGLQVRLVDTDLASGPEPYPVDDDTTIYYGTVALPAGRIPGEFWSIPLGFKVGGQTTLPDGTRVRVLSADPGGARISVTRPPDTSAPTMSMPRIEYSGGKCTRYPCTVPASAIRNGTYRIFVNFGVFDDDQWVASISASVNGVETFIDDRPTPDGTDEETSMSPGSGYWGDWRTYRPGRYTIVYAYTDLAGNTGTSTYLLTLPKPKKKR